MAKYLAQTGGTLVEVLSINQSNGINDADKIVSTNSGGTIDNSFLNLTSINITDFNDAVTGNTVVQANTAKVSASGSINTHSDVDISTTPPNTGETLVWDGSNFVPQLATLFNNAKSTGSVQANGTPNSLLNATVNKVGVGLYDITFIEPLSNNNYPILLTAGENTSLFDDIILKYESVLNTGFTIRITEQDNGGTPGVAIDADFSFFIPALDGIPNSNVVVHAALSGLTEDDHLQYLTEIRHDALPNDNPHSVTFTQAVTADSGTDITNSEAEQLTDGSNADILHNHSSLAISDFNDAVTGNTVVQANTLSRHDAVNLIDSSLSITGQTLQVKIDDISNGGNNTLQLTSEGLYVPPITGTTQNIAASGVTYDNTNTPFTGTTVQNVINQIDEYVLEQTTLNVQNINIPYSATTEDVILFTTNNITLYDGALQRKKITIRNVGNNNIYIYTSNGQLIENFTNGLLEAGNSWTLVYNKINNWYII